ncbi:MAG: hypothetical protein ACKVQU_07935 [Burkholderiales bacterium]
MSVLAEAFSVVVPVSVLARSYPGGISRYERESPNRSFCSDGVLTRIAFLARKDAEYFVGLLQSEGLTSYERGVFVDVALLDQNIGSLAPCLWLEFARERRGTPVCWHAASRRGALHVPQGWEHAASLVHTRFIGRSFAEQLRYLRGEAQLDWYHDRSSGRLFTTPQAFTLH